MIKDQIKHLNGILAKEFEVKDLVQFKYFLRSDMLIEQQMVFIYHKGNTQ